MIYNHEKTIGLSRYYRYQKIGKNVKCSLDVEINLFIKYPCNTITFSMHWIHLSLVILLVYTHNYLIRYDLIRLCKYLIYIYFEIYFRLLMIQNSLKSCQCMPRISWWDSPEWTAEQWAWWEINPKWQQVIGHWI